MSQPNFPRTVPFDLLTALIDSWTLWSAAAGSERAGRAWRAERLRLTYGCGAYVAYEDLVREAAQAVGPADAALDYLETHWSELAPWSGAQDTLDALQGRCKLAVVTGVPPKQAAFVAGSALDLAGTTAVGLRTYWHNRVGLPRPAQLPPPVIECATFERLIPWLEGQA